MRTNSILAIGMLSIIAAASVYFFATSLLQPTLESQTASVANAIAGNCSLDGSTLGSGLTRTYYSAQTMPLGKTCPSVAQSRTCTGGVLSGTATYRYASCTETPAIAVQATVGMNDLFILQYAMTKGYSDPTGGGNSIAMSLSSIQGYLDALTQRGVTVQREGVPFRGMLTSSALPAMGDVVKEFEKRKMILILFGGFPVPEQKTAQNSWCFLPAGEDDAAGNDAEWTARTTLMGDAFKAFMLYLKSRTDIDQTWLANNVIIEPTNEFDGLAKYDPRNVCTGQGFGTPKRAATLYWAVKSALSGAGVNNEVTAPSIVGVYSGPLTRPNLGLGAWYYDYYQVYGGSGRPSIHPYPNLDHAPDKNAASIANVIRDETVEMLQAVPAQYDRGAILGETGVTQLSAKCAAGFSDQVRADVYQRVITDPTIASKVSRILFWRIIPDFPNDTDCNYAMVPIASWRTTPSFNPAGEAILKTLGGMQAPTNLQSRCSADGKNVTLSWSSVAGAGTYPVRFSASGISCPSGQGWFSANPGECDLDTTTATSITLPVVAGKTYTWWVHAKSAAWSGAAVSSFACGRASVAVNPTLTPSSSLGLLVAIPQSGSAPLVVVFSADASLAGSTLDFGDGARATIPPAAPTRASVSHTYRAAGSYAAKATRLSSDTVLGGCTTADCLLVHDVANRQVVRTLASTVVTVSGATTAGTATGATTGGTGTGTNTTNTTNTSGTGATQTGTTNTTTNTGTTLTATTNTTTVVPPVRPTSMAGLTNEQRVQLLYIGYLGRTGSASEVAYWVGQMRAGLSLEKAAQSFGMSEEGSNMYTLFKYPDVATPSYFLNKVYQQMFDRAPDTIGATYWLREIADRLHDPARLTRTILDIQNGAQGTDLTILLGKLPTQ